MYRPIQGRASARLRRAAIVSLLSAGSIASAGDPVESKAPQPSIQSNPYVDTGAPRIVAVRPVKSRTTVSNVCRIPTHPSVKGSVIRQTEFTNPLAKQFKESVADPKSVLVQPSTVRLNPIKPMDSSEPSIEQATGVGSSPKTAVPVARKDSPKGISFSISDDTIEMPVSLPEPTLVRSGVTKIIEVELEPTETPVNKKRGSAPIWKVPEIAKQDAQSTPAPTPLPGELPPKKEFDAEMPSVVIKSSPNKGIGHERDELEMIGSSGPESLQGTESPTDATAPAIKPAPLRVVETVKQKPKQTVATPLPAESTEPRKSTPSSVAAIDSVVEHSNQSPPVKLKIHAKCELAAAESKPLFIAHRVVKVSVEEPAVCEALTGAGDTVVLIGRKTGTTRIAVWTDSTPNLEPLVYEVSVNGPTENSKVDGTLVILREALRKTFPKVSLRVTSINDGYQVSGTTKTELEAKKIMHLVRSICLEPIQDSIKVR